MTSPSSPARSLIPGWAVLALPLALLAACAEAPQQTRSEQAQYEACHRQADQIVERANVNLLNQQDPISSPYAAASILPSSTTNLSIEHQREQVMNDCLHHLDSSAPNVGDVTATPSAARVQAPITAPPSNLAGPTGNDLTKPPILPPPQ
ncbi:MAG: hypothetical protein HIU92_07320 [Proteobacteria bacterium]|nr:hypothetical protein [Pseudomonadota bacterium]